MKYVITFDIAQKRRRAAVAKRCLAIGTRVQESVFEAFFSPEELKTFDVDIRKLIDLDADSVRIYPLDAQLDLQIRIIGVGRRVTEPEQSLII